MSAGLYIYLKQIIITNKYSKTLKSVLVILHLKSIMTQSIQTLLS